ncbi:MAG: thiamine pyrophosphate-binding protein, partial [Myxococcota bacterium]
AYGLSYHKIANSAGVEDGIRKVLAQKGPVVCEVVCDRDQEIKPTVSAFTRPDGTMVSKPIEDMYPFLDREEFVSNMIVKPLDD